MPFSKMVIEIGDEIPAPTALEEKDSFISKLESKL